LHLQISHAAHKGKGLRLLTKGIAVREGKIAWIQLSRRSGGGRSRGILQEDAKGREN